MTVYGKEKRPLSYFEGIIREAILGEHGVGPKTYAKIRRALFWRSLWRSLALVLVSPLKRNKTQKKRTPARILGLLLLALILVGLAWLAVLWFYSSNLASASAVVQYAYAASPTPNQVMVEVAATAEAESVELPVTQDGFIYLRVETQQLDTKYGIWRRMPGIPVFLSPFVDGDAVPSSDREGTLRQVTEELLTSDVFLVAVTTFEVQPGTYWIWVDEPGLPAGCVVWVPHFGEDADSGVVADEPVVVVLDAYEGFNTFVVKFQIICGVEAGPTPTVVNNSPPGQTSSPVPPTDPPPTDPPPTAPPPPPTEVICTGCQEPPQTPVPTPVPIEVTATPTR